MTICRKAGWAASIDPKFKPLQNILFQHFDITPCEAALLQAVISKLGKSTVQAADILGITLQKRETPGEPLDPPVVVVAPKPEPVPPPAPPDPIAPGSEPGDTEGDLSPAPDSLVPGPGNGNGPTDDFVPPGLDIPPGQFDLEALMKQVPKEVWIVGGVILAWMILK